MVKEAISVPCVLCDKFQLKDCNVVELMKLVDKTEPSLINQDKSVDYLCICMYVLQVLEESRTSNRLIDNDQFFQQQQEQVLNRLCQWLTYVPENMKDNLLDLFVDIDAYDLLVDLVVIASAVKIQSLCIHVLALLFKSNESVAQELLAQDDTLARIATRDSLNLSFASLLVVH